jgi:hypothetical protein
VTEDEWTTCNNPKAMVSFLAVQHRASGRKLRLFSCACCRRVWHLLADERARRAVEVAERFADGVATEREREEAQRAAAGVRQLSGIAAKWAAAAVARTGAMMVADAAGQTAACHPGHEYEPVRWHEESLAQCDLLRDLLGPLPFRGVSFEPCWRTPHVIEIAQPAYDERSFGRMLELGRALYQAGCHDRELLHHCLWSGEHARGCWVLDLVLNKS